MKKYQGCLLILALCLLGNQAQAIEFSLFGDTQFVSKGDDASFDLGSLDLSAEKNISDTSVITADVLFENLGHEGYEIEVERFKVSRELRPGFKISMGIFNIGLGFWQQTFHHGSLSQDTVTTPFFLENLERHDGVITAHATGFAIEGKRGKFGYQLTLTNPAGMNTSEPETAHGGERVEVADLSNSAPKRKFTNLLRLSYSPKWNSEIGLVVENKPIIETAEKDQIEAPIADCGLAIPAGRDRSQVETGDELFHSLRTGVDYFFNGDNFYTYLEYNRIMVDDGDFILSCYGEAAAPNLLPKKRYKANAYYLQLGYRINPELALTVRHEDLSIDDAAPLYQLSGWESQRREVLGLSYRFDASNALRFEYSKAKYAELTAGEEQPKGEFRIQWFFLVL